MKAVESNTCTDIENLTAEFPKAVTNMHFATIGTYYEGEARLIPPGGRMVVGRAAIQAAQQKMIESGVQDIKLQAVDVIESSDYHRNWTS